MAYQNNMNNSFGGYPGNGMGYGSPRPNGQGNNKSNGKKGKKKKSKSEKKALERKMQARYQRERQQYALQNADYRRKVQSIEGRGGIDNRYYELPKDEKVRKGKDYFFVMRKFVCLLMTLVLLVCVAFYVLDFVKIAEIADYTALFVQSDKVAAAPEQGSEDKKDEGEDDQETTEENASVGQIKTDGDGAPADDGEPAGAGEELPGEESAPEKDKSKGTNYGVLDPIFGFLRFVGSKLGVEIDLGASPLYDAMLAKTEVGMTDTVSVYLMYAFPVAMILYVLIALIMAIKAFFGMFGKRIFKGFGLGAILMILCAAVTLLGGLAFTTPVEGKLDFKGIVNILIGGLTGVGGFTGGLGLLIMIALPVVVLILSMFARKKIPYSIFDTFGDF